MTRQNSPTLETPARADSYPAQPGRFIWQLVGVLDT
jgi:hypothetical protein